MSRVIHTDGPGQQRHRLRRTIAEMLRRLMRKRRFDDEARDLAALIVFSLRELAAGVDQSASAWEKRGYFLKADRFRSEWEWLEPTAAELSRLIVHEDWKRVPVVLAGLTPRFSDIRVKRLTRSSAVWQGCYDRLLEVEPSSP
jgi:hypothetical protein